MRIIVVGCGKVGETITEQLIKEGHDISVVDNDPDVIEDLTNNLDVLGVVGNGASHEVLLEAGLEQADLLIAVMPLSDGTGVEGIIDVAQRHPQLMSILLVRQEAYEQVTYQCRNQQIFVIAMPFKRQVLAEAASFMLRIRTVIDDKDKELARMRKNLNEIRIITSAKIRLMQTRQMTEEEAHYYLEKEAMDRSLSKKEVAEEILR